jgi:hypothetical protein
MCAEQVQDAAVVCRHCGSTIGALAPEAAMAGAAAGASPGTATPWPQQRPYPGGMPVARTNGMAIASLVCGLLWFWGVGSILGIVFGHVAKNQIRASGGREGGRGMATAGQVLGWLGVATAIIVTIVVIVAANSADSYDCYPYC